jgi:SAM-dependent methyltransferase
MSERRTSQRIDRKARPVGTVNGIHPMRSKAFAILHHGLPREGPGHDDVTREALRRLPALPPRPVVFDLGCGPGRQTLVLARALETRIVAVDHHQPFLDQLTRIASEQGLTQWIEPRCADIGALDVPPGSVDLVWSEGAAYILGFEEALRRWRNLLASGGILAVTECTWFTEVRPAQAQAFWHVNYPTMGTATENARRAEVLGLEVLDSFPLPRSAWWDDYYTPLLDRIAALRPTASRDLIGVFDETEREIELYRNYGHSYGYVFYILRSASRIG